MVQASSSSSYILPAFHSDRLSVRCWLNSLEPCGLCTEGVCGPSQTQSLQCQTVERKCSYARDSVLVGLPNVLT